MKKVSWNFLEKLRWKGFWWLDSFKKTELDTLYSENFYAFKNGTSYADTEEKLRRLMDHARKNTEFYKDIPEDAKLTDFPVVDKEVLRNNYDSILVKSFADAPGSRKMSTSGSTGTPLTIVQDRNKVLHDTVDGIFLGVLGNYYIGQKMAFIRVWVHNVRKSPLVLFMQNYIMMDSSSLSDESIKKMLDTLKKQKVRCVVGYASALTEISKYIDRTSYDLTGHVISSIIPISESMPEKVRERLSCQFGCYVQSWYSNEENGIMGIQGRNCEDYYINSENYYYEILKMDSDEPAEDGELGRIVITDLNNFAFPIIRYDNGDTAIARHVDKGQRYKLFLKQIYGRRSDIIYDTEGNALTPFIITNNLWDAAGVKQYQFIQKGKTKYLLKLNGDPEIMDIEDIRGRIIPYLGSNAQMEIEFTDEIPVLASGKRKYIVCELSDQ
ncbi:MAG: phenylacetate--CoA ligase family protein [Lachnospiraceae bacterium]